MQKHHWIFIASVLMGVLVGFLIGRSSLNIPEVTKTPFGKTTDGIACDYLGKSYKNGEGFKDACNSCTCTDGKVQCTLIACE